MKVKVKYKIEGNKYPSTIVLDNVLHVEIDGKGRIEIISDDE